MATEMVFKMVVIFLWFLIAIASTTEVDISTAWKPNMGWTADCSWKLYSNDSLQSVRLYREKNEQQFMIYRPENHGPRHRQTFTLSEGELEVDCSFAVAKGLSGNCILTMNLNKPPTSDIYYVCEVSGERPTFRIGKKDVHVPAFVAPTDAVINVVTLAEQSSDQVKLKCTSAGIPAPSLVWSVGDQKVPQDFSGSAWNLTTKLWDVWSEFSYIPSQHVATCVPETSRGTELVKGGDAVYSAAKGVSGMLNIIITVVTLIISLR